MAKTSKGISEKEKDKTYGPGAIILGHYEVRKVIARGGMNSVLYLATDTNVVIKEYSDTKKKNVTIKIIKKTSDISENEWRKFWDESVTLGRLKKKGGEYTAEVYERGYIDPETFYIVMEYIEGESLARVINSQGHLSVDETLYITIKILESLKELHKSFANKIIHRDLKPDNIILSDNWITLKIIDFGIATSFRDDKSNGTIEDEIFGTFPYLTPQILELRGVKDKERRRKIIEDIGVQFDFYALGIIMYEMLIGKKPFEYKGDDENKINALYYPIDYDIPLISEIKNIPVGVENIILKLMASKNITTNKMFIPHRDSKPRKIPQGYKTLPYDDVDDIIKDVKDVKDHTNINNVKTKLLKPFHDRRFQDDAKIFTIFEERQPIFDRPWVFWGCFCLTILLSIFAVFMFHLF
ncbi:MAG: serine/threonine protein kinase [Mycoplasmataceae bacterium]|nr:serine/threonine protein kinase [Mycoplasmataceae bacterium]